MTRYQYRKIVSEILFCESIAKKGGKELSTWFCCCYFDGVGVDETTHVTFYSLSLARSDEVMAFSRQESSHRANQ